MTPAELPELWRRFRRKAREVGVRGALREGALRLLADDRRFLPLSRIDPAGVFATDVGAIHEREKDQIRTTSLMFDASQVETTYPEAFEHDGRFLRYAFLPATDEPRGLVVLFHGHNAFLHFGPTRPWRHFDVLAPWDTFGLHRQGSWFWGEKGVPFVETMVQALISQFRERNPERPWFCMGSSMGGFGALYHGVKYGCRGLYVMCPQVDLEAKIADYEDDGQGNPYAHLRGQGGEKAPSLVDVAGDLDSLPPLFLIQNQYDHVNRFRDHAFRLIDVYNEKNCWYGLRIHPAIGHGGDGAQEEAELFFSLILDRNPPNRVAT